MYGLAHQIANNGSSGATSRNGGGGKGDNSRRLAVRQMRMSRSVVAQRLIWRSASGTHKTYKAVQHYGQEGSLRAGGMSSYLSPWSIATAQAHADGRGAEKERTHWLAPLLRSSEPTAKEERHNCTRAAHSDPGTRKKKKEKGPRHD